MKITKIPFFTVISLIFLDNYQIFGILTMYFVSVEIVTNLSTKLSFFWKISSEFAAGMPKNWFLFEKLISYPTSTFF